MHPTSRAESLAAYAPLVILTAAVFPCRERLTPWAFMWLLSLAIFAGLKWFTWWRARRDSPSVGRSFAYLALWPGMDAKTFLASPAPPLPSPRDWVTAVGQMLVGAALFWAAPRYLAPEHWLLRGWLGMAGLVFLLHFGLFRAIAFGWQAMGVRALPIMNAPHRSASLAELWGQRWNLGFRDFAHVLVFQPVARRTGAASATFAVFLFSGLIHDLVISIPARAGYGLPTLYFALQGAAVLLERRLRLPVRAPLVARIGTIAVAAAPAFLLFHPAFVERVIIPFMHMLGAL